MNRIQVGCFHKFHIFKGELNFTVKLTLKLALAAVQILLELTDDHQHTTALEYVKLPALFKSTNLCI